MKSRKGFSLMELLAVIVILGLLLLIAIPSVTKYIDGSRKSVYINTVKEIIKGASHLVTKGKLDIDDTDTTYYIPYTCINMEDKEAKTPYGNFKEAYVVLTYNEDKSYDYYFYGYDEQGFGIVPITEEEALDADCIRTGIESINTNKSIDRRKNIIVYGSDCSSIDIEKRATESNDPNDKNAVFLDGKSFNMKIKKIANNGSSYSYLDADYSIKEIIQSEEEPGDEYKQAINVVSVSTSENPIYMWFDNGTLYWWSEDKYPSLAPDSRYMFSYLKSLTSFEIGNFDTSKVTNMGYFFSDNTNITYYDLDGIDTSNVTIMNDLFYNNAKLESLDVSALDTRNVTDMSYIFGGCKKIKELDLSSLNTSNVTSMYALVTNCTALNNIIFGKKFDTSKVKNMRSMFARCSSFTELDLSVFDTSKVTDMSFMFIGCSSLKNMDLSNFDTHNCTDMFDLFWQCSNLEWVDVSSFDTSNVTNMCQMFSQCPKLTSVDVSGFKTGKVTSMRAMFSNCVKLENIDVSKWDTGEVRDMVGMFEHTAIKSIDVSHFDMHNVTECWQMFCQCDNLVTANLSHWNTVNCETFNNLFFGCDSLKSVDFSYVDLSSATSLFQLFWGCTKLNTVNFEGVDTSHVQNFGLMFCHCWSLRNYDISHFDYSSQTDTRAMYC